MQWIDSEINKSGIGGQINNTTEEEYDFEKDKRNK
jgi:hypothetical protein